MADDGVCVWTKSAEKYNGYGFPVRSSHCERNNQEESKPFESGCSFKNITDDGDYFVVGCFERKNILNLEDAVRFLPGVTVKDQLGAFTAFRFGDRMRR